MFKTDNSFNLLIGTSQAYDAASLDALANGEIMIFDEVGAQMSAGDTFADSRYIQLVQRTSANDLVWSARIDGANVLRYEGTSPSAAVQQVDHVGFNEVSGDFDATGVEDYVLRLAFKHDKDMWSQQSNTRQYRFTPSATTTNEDLAASFATQIDGDAFMDDQVIVERVADGTYGTPLANMQVTNGSKSVTTSGAHSLSVGDYFRAGASVAGTAVYTVASVESTTAFTLDQRYVGATDAALTANVNTIPATDWGLRITGLAQTFTVGKFPDVVVSFDTTLENMGTTSVTKSTRPAIAVGSGNKIAELEFMSVGFDGAVDKFGDSAPTGRSDADTTAVYDQINIEYVLNESGNVVSGSKPSRQLLSLAIVESAAQTTSILNILNPWMASLPRAFANVAV